MIAGQSRVEHYFSALDTFRGRDAFHQEYRVLPELFFDIEARLAVHLAPSVDSFRRDTLTLRERIAIPMASFGSQAEDVNVCKNYGIGTSTLAGLVDRFNVAFIAVYKRDTIRLPTAEECSEIAHNIYLDRGFVSFRLCVFFSLFLSFFLSTFLVLTIFLSPTGMPGCALVFDGKHFGTSSGADDPQSFRCYKGGRSLNMVGGVDHSLSFRWVSDFWPGNTSDSRILYYSKLGEMMRNDQWPPQVNGGPIAFELNQGTNLFRLPVQVLADGGFSGTKNILKPYSSATMQTVPVRIFNLVQVRASFSVTMLS